MMIERYINGEKRDVTNTIDDIRCMLMEHFKDNKDALIIWTNDDMFSDYALDWKIAKALFNTLAMLLDYEPDTPDGNKLLSEVYDESGLSKYIDKEYFDNFMWIC